MIWVAVLTVIVAVAVSVPTALWADRIYKRFPDRPSHPDYPDVQPKRYPRTRLEWQHALAGGKP